MLLRVLLHPAKSNELNMKLLQSPCFILKQSHCLEPHVAVTLHYLEQLLGALPEPYQLVGDFKAHPSFRGSEQTDVRGHILDFSLCNNVCLLNAGKHTFCTPCTEKNQLLRFFLLSTICFYRFYKGCAGQLVCK